MLFFKKNFILYIFNITIVVKVILSQKQIWALEKSVKKKRRRLRRVSIQRVVPNGNARAWRWQMIFVDSLRVCKLEPTSLEL